MSGTPSPGRKADTWKIGLSQECERAEDAPGSDMDIAFVVRSKSVADQGREFHDSARSLVTLARSRSCNPAVTPMVTAAIAYDDAITAKARGVVNHQDHQGAPRPLREVPGVFRSGPLHRLRGDEVEVNGARAGDRVLTGAGRSCRRSGGARADVVVTGDAARSSARFAPLQPSRSTLNSLNHRAGSTDWSRQVMLIGRSPSAPSSTTGPQARYGSAFRTRTNSWNRQPLAALSR